jgi:hypothetical protein
MNVRILTAALASLSFATFSASAFADGTAPATECSSGVSQTSGLCSTLGVRTPAPNTNVAASQSVGNSGVSSTAGARPSRRMNASAFRMPASHEHSSRSHR